MQLPTHAGVRTDPLPCNVLNVCRPQLKNIYKSDEKAYSDQGRIGLHGYINSKGISEILCNQKKE
jgi:hypothetical protein